MPVEKSAGAVVFRKEENNIFYLLLHYPTSSKTSKDYWDLPKGHIEKGEKETETAKREVKEETGLADVKIIPEFKESIRYFFKAQGKTVFKIVTFYLAEAKTKNVSISGEHIGFKWLPFEEAVNQLTFKNAKKVVEKANQFIRNKLSSHVAQS